MGRDLKFVGYVHHYKILPGNIFGLILKRKMAAMGIIGRVLKFAGYVLAGYVHHYKSFLNIFGLIAKNKMADAGISSMIMEFYTFCGFLPHSP